MTTILMKCILISYFIVMFTIIGNREKFIERLEEYGYYEFSSFHKIVYIAAGICISILLVVPIFIKEIFLDS